MTFVTGWRHGRIPPPFFPLPVPRCFWRSSTELTPATSAFVSHSSRLFFILNIFFYFLFFSLLLLPRLRNVLSRCAYTQSRKEKLNAPRSSNSWWCFIPEREGGGGESIASVSSQITRLVSNWPFQLKPVFFFFLFWCCFYPSKKSKKKNKKTNEKCSIGERLAFWVDTFIFSSGEQRGQVRLVCFESIWKPRDWEKELFSCLFILWLFFPTATTCFRFGPERKRGTL